MLSDFKASCFSGSMLQSPLASSFRLCQLPEERCPVPLPCIRICLLFPLQQKRREAFLVGYQRAETGVFSGYVLTLTFCIWCQGRRLCFSHKPLFVSADRGRIQRAAVAPGSDREWQVCLAGCRLLLSCMETNVQGSSGDMTVWNQNSLPLSRCEMVFLVNKQK